MEKTEIIKQVSDRVGFDIAENIDFLLKITETHLDKYLKLRQQQKHIQVSNNEANMNIEIPSDYSSTRLITRSNDKRIFELVALKIFKEYNNNNYSPVYCINNNEFLFNCVSTIDIYYFSKIPRFISEPTFIQIEYPELFITALTIQAYIHKGMLEKAEPFTVLETKLVKEANSYSNSGSYGNIKLFPQVNYGG